MNEVDAETIPNYRYGMTATLHYYAIILNLFQGLL
jgi:hypothetical protein